MSRVLLVEDDPHLSEGILFNLRNSGYDVDAAATGEAALEAIEGKTYDVILLDLMLPGIDGLEVARHIRRRGLLAPILIITARDRPEDAVRGLDAGADDYIPKPFDLDELLARIRGALRRQVWSRTFPQPAASQGLQYGKWWVDFQTYVASTPDGKEVPISAREIAMLKLFSSRPGDVISRATFLEEVWGLPSTIETRTVDNFIRRLRMTLEDDPANPRHIVSVRGAGYRFVP